MNVSWPHIRLNLQQYLSEATCKVWIDPLKGELIQPDPVGNPMWRLKLVAGSAFVANWVRERFQEAIMRAATEVLGCAPDLSIEALPQASPKKPEPLTAELLARQLPSAPALLASNQQLTLPVNLPRVSPKLFSSSDWKYSFADFVVGPCNQLAHAAASNMIQSTSPVDILFLCSAPGLGKTHLTQAVGSALCLEARKSQVAVEYLTAEEFTSQFVQASKFGDMNQFKERFRNLDMLLLEDVHFLRGKDKTQEELLSTIKSLQSHGGRVVFTSSFAPRELSGVDSQLVSRFCSGFVAALEKPGRDTRLHILQQKARLHNVPLPGAVAELLADRITSDVRLLESCLHNLALKSSLLGRRISEELALEVMASVASRNPELSLDSLLDLVCRSFSLDPRQLASRSRRQDLVTARNTAFYLARKHTSLTLEEIGERFNRRHSTVIKGITSVEREMSRQSPLGRQLAGTVAMIEKNAGRSARV